MKKLFCILLAAMLLSMASCSKEVETEAPVDTDPVDTIAETEPETEPETEKETKKPRPKKVAVFTPVYTDNFDDPDNSKWKANNQLSDFKIADGYLTATSTGGDPSIKADGFEMDCATIQAVRLKFINNTPDSNFQIFFTTDTTTGYSEAASVKDISVPSSAVVEVSAAADSDEWNEMVVYVDTCDLWEGTLKNMRIDLSNGEGSYIVDSIEFCSVEWVEQEAE